MLWQPLLKTARISIITQVNFYTMAVLQTIRNIIKYKALHVPDKGSQEAYDLWADNYDDQPDNLMFYLDQSVFTELMVDVPVRDKTIADIGCGTGRHWPLLFQNRPAKLTGYDVSDGMLKRLKLKFPDADTTLITDNFLGHIADDTYDTIISTLTVAHIENLDEAMAEWCRVLKPGGNIIITDFHPKALAAGGKRTFQYQNTHIPIVNFVHPTDAIKSFFATQGFTLVNEVEKVIDNTVMHYYIKQNAIHVYQKFRGMPMIYGLHLKKG
jgi:ubiquinone/menaquinone biosynthesis C-methylase UbiE